MDDLICNEAVLKAFPAVGHLILIYISIQATARAFSEAFFLVAHVCGKIESRITKVIGKGAWTAGRITGVIGFGVSKLYLSKRYVKRG